MSYVPGSIKVRIREAAEKQQRELDLSWHATGYRLEEMPVEVFELEHLEKLDLRDNQIQEIPSEISKLKNLKSLDLIGNKQFTEIPQKLLQLPSLVYLGLPCQSNKNPPGGSNRILQLGLDISDKKLTAIPDHFGNLQNLILLRLWWNLSEPLPSWLEQQEILELDLSSNQLTSLPESITKLTNIQELYLRDNQLKSLPESITRLTNLARLDLSSNQLTSLPESITKLTNLTHLDLEKNQLKSLPESITKLTNLTRLYWWGNQLKTVSESITKLTNLTHLDLSSNQLTSFPESITKLTNLTQLYLSSNQLKTVSESITKLTNLTQLYLSSNQLTSFPESITKLTNLTQLYLSSNQLKTVSELITKLTNLTQLYLRGNPLETPPIEIATKGIEAIREYFRQLEEEGKDYIYEAKLLIVGEGGAGKTTLVKKIKNPKYQLRNDEASTEGIDIHQWSFPIENECTFLVNIWDFGGQEIYHATHQFFLTKRSLYVLVADTRKEDTDFYYWLNVVELLSDNSPLLIVKNEKGDRRIEIDENSLRGRFKNLKESLAANFKDNRGLKDILDSIQYNIKKLPHVGNALPKTWKRVREALTQDERNYISLKEYLTICQDNGFSQLKDKLQLSRYLHDLGVCLHFQDSTLLKNTVILKPEWGTDAVYKVLDDKEVINNLGRFTTGVLENIWSEEKYTFKKAELLELMRRFKLCYKIPETEDTYIAPQLLTKKKPDYPWDENNNLILRYIYEFIPKGIITQFIVVMHQYIDKQQKVWRSGVVLDKDDTRAEVIEYYDQRRITIRVSGGNKKDLITIVSYELDKIHNSYRDRLKVKKLIPCNCSECKGQQEPYFYEFDVLQNAKKKGKIEIECQKSFEKVNVLKLTDDIFTKYLESPNNNSVMSQNNLTKVQLIVENRNNEHIKDAKVTFFFSEGAEERVTDSLGSVQSPRPIQDSIKVKIEHKDYQTKTQNINYPLPDNRSLHIQLDSVSKLRQKLGKFMSGLAIVITITGISLSVIVTWIYQQIIQGNTPETPTKNIQD